MRRTLALAALPLTLSCFACNYAPPGHDRAGSDQGGSDGGVTVQDEIPRSNIDVTSPVTGYAAGQGAGLFVDYESGGGWNIQLACDTYSSGYDCNWDVIASPVNATVNDYSAVSLDADDWIGQTADGSVRVNSWTSTEIDRFHLTTKAAAALEIDALLDGLSAEHYVYWNGNGGLHRGAPANPIELVPAAP